MRKRRSFFYNKTCDICKKPAIIFRIIGNKKYMICEDKHCDLKTRIKHGFFGEIPLKKEKK